MKKKWTRLALQSLLLIALMLLVSCTQSGTNPIISKDLQVSKNHLSGTVSHATETFNFEEDISVLEDYSWFISADKEGKNIIDSQTVLLKVGDNVFYIHVQKADETTKVYTVKIHRNLMFEVRFNTECGAHIEPQTVEEGQLATAPDAKNISRLGYIFDSWNFDFSTPITQNITVTPNWAIAPEMENFTFTSTENELIITGLEDRSVNSICIPHYVTEIKSNAFKRCEELEIVTFAEGSQCKAIGSDAFYECSKLKEITIPASVEKLGIMAFYHCRALEKVTFAENSQCTILPTDLFLGCSALTEIVIPSSVMQIGATAFGCCTNLKSVTFEKNSQCTTISFRAFEMCQALVEAVIPASVTALHSPFFGCTSLEKITVEEGNPVYHSDGNCLISTESKTLILGCSQSVIPADGSVTKLEIDAFCANKGLTEITIPAAITEANWTVFAGCANLKNVIFEAGSQLSYIPLGMFSGCTSLEKIELPASVTVIEEYAFSGCTALTSVTLPDNLSEIHNYAFEDCISLKEIHFPTMLTEFAIYAFKGCTGIEKITVAENNPVYRSIENCLIHTKKEAVVWGCKNSNIPSNGCVKKIEESAFEGCTGLTEINIPSTVTLVGKRAFANCTSLVEVIIPASVTHIGAGVFAGCENMKKIYFLDTSTWYSANGKENWLNQNGSDTLDVSDPTLNAKFFMFSSNFYYFKK